MTLHTCPNPATCTLCSPTAGATFAAPSGETPAPAPEKCARCGWSHPRLECAEYARRKRIVQFFAAHHHSDLIESFLGSYDGASDHDSIRDAFRPLLPSVASLDSRLLAAETESQRWEAVARTSFADYQAANDDACRLAEALSVVLDRSVFSRGPDDWRVKCVGGELAYQTPESAIQRLTLDMRSLTELVEQYTTLVNRAPTGETTNAP